MTFFTPFPAKSTAFSSKLHSHFFTIQNPRASTRQRVPQLRGVSRNRGEKLNTQNPSVTPLTPPFLNPLPPCRPLRHWREQSAFTLVELLAVVGIMGLLAAVAVPALKGLTGSGGRKQALSQVMGALEIARNTAIASGTNAAVIFPDSTFGLGDAYKYRSMAVVSYADSTINANETTTPIAYDKLVSSWIVLPQGISFLPNYLKTSTTSNMISVTANIRIPPSTNSTSITCPGIIFQSDGGLLDGATNSTAGVGFFEGTVTGTTTNGTSKMNNFETVRLTRYTGRTIPTLAPAP